MLIEHLGKRPAIDPEARIAPTAVVCGDVTVGPRTSVGFGAVLTAESGPIVVGRECVVMENAVIRGTKRHPATIGDHVLIGPGAYLSGCVIRDCAFLATGSRVFNGAIVGARAEVRINATVHLLTNLAEDTMVPIGWVAVGDPGADPAAGSAQRDLGDTGAAQLPEGDLRGRPAEPRRDANAGGDGPLLPGALTTPRRPGPVKQRHRPARHSRLLALQDSGASVS